MLSYICWGLGVIVLEEKAEWQKWHQKWEEEKGRWDRETQRELERENEAENDTCWGERKWRRKRWVQ